MKAFFLKLLSHRTLALLRWDIYFLQLRLSNLLPLKKRRLHKKLCSHGPKKYLNLGSGPRGINNNLWVNVDGFKDKNVDYLCDFNRKLPFKDQSFDSIFCEHVLEHFSFEDGKKLMKECVRILKSNGVIRIIVPNGNTILKAYFETPDKILQYKECVTGSPIEAVNKWFYQRYEHQCIYDADYLITLLKLAGFKDAKQAGFMASAFSDADLIIDDPKYSWESLYVEAIK